MARKPATFRNDSTGAAYKRKATDLSKKQLGKAGRAAAGKRTVDISTTRRETSGANKGKTLGPGGKPLTGTVKLPGGEIAVYKDGKRVTAKPAAKPAKPASTGGRSGSSGSGSSGSSSGGSGAGSGSGSGSGGKGKDKGGKGNGKPASSTARLGRTYTTTTQTNPQASSASASAARRAAAERAARASGQVPSASRSYANGSSAAPSRANRGDELGLNPATGGTRANPSPYVNSATQNQRNAGRTPAAGGSKNKRGGERRTPEQQARDRTRRNVRDLNR